MKKGKKVKFNLEGNKSDGEVLSSKNRRDSKIEKKFKKENMVVAVRVRPLNNREIEFSNLETTQISGREVVTVLDPIEYKGGEEAGRSRVREQQYAFDFAFNKNAQQEEVYMYTTQFLLQGVLEGFNATVFAYGATGAGKTYTMVGNGDNPGVMVRSLSDLFNLVEKQVDKDFKIQISYLEVYNETLRDLLMDGQSEEVEIREDPNKGVFLVGQREVPVLNATDVFRLLM